MIAFSYNHFYHILTITKIFVWWDGMFVCRPYVWGMCMCCQVDQQMGTAAVSQMADPNWEDDQVTLLGKEELLTAGHGRSLGYGFITFLYVVLVLNVLITICFDILFNTIM